MKKKILKGIIPYSDLNKNLIPEPEKQTIDEFYELLIEISQSKDNRSDKK